MIKLLTILLIGLVLEAVGVVFLSKGLKQVGQVEQVSVREIARVVKRGLTNPSILIGVALEAAFFACLLVLMSRGDVSFIWPLTALGFVLTTLAARFLLDEHVSGWRWMGVVLIVGGAAIISWTEQHKPTAKGAGPDPMVKAESP